MTKPKSCWHSTVRFIFSGCVEEGGLLPLPLAQIGHQTLGRLPACVMQHASHLAEGVAGYVEAQRETGCGQKRARCPKASFSQSETDSACLMTGLGLVMNPWLVKLVSFILPAVQASIIVNHRQQWNHLNRGILPPCGTCCQTGCRIDILYAAMPNIVNGEKPLIYEKKSVWLRTTDWFRPSTLFRVSFNHKAKARIMFEK